MVEVALNSFLDVLLWWAECVKCFMEIVMFQQW